MRCFKRYGSTITLTILGIALIGASRSAMAQTVSVTILQPVSGYTLTSASAAINGTQVGYGITGTNSYALEWHGTNTATSLQPASGYSGSQADSISGELIGGQGTYNGTIAGTTSGNTTALLWNTGTSSVTDLNPVAAVPTLIYSTVTGVDTASGASGEETGYAMDPSGNLHAILWTGQTASSATDLNKIGSLNSAQAFGISNNTVVGEGEGVPTGGVDHAYMWSGSTATDLGAVLGSTYLISAASAVSGNLVVGYAAPVATPESNHAIVWNVSGPTPTFTDINPAGSTESQADAVSNGIVVGETDPNGNPQAAYFGLNGTQYVNLQNYLPLDPLGAAYTWSIANGIASDGSIVGLAAYTSGSTTIENAVMWKVSFSPAPGGLPVLAGGMSLMTGFLARSRRRARRQ
jgi:hypothetical protein